MARLINCIKNTSILLRTEHVFGRQKNQSHTVLTDAAASRIHAVIVWCFNHWQLRDVSSNGTYVNGKRLQKYNTVILAKGDKLNFGGSAIEPHTVKDLSPPAAHLEPIPPNTEWIELIQSTSLPSERETEITLYLDRDKWHCEKTGGQSSVLHTGDKVNVKDRQWTFVSLPISSHTIALEQYQIEQKSVALTFNVSQNEEHVNLVLIWNGHSLDLGERTHHYLILVLARKKLEDENKGINSMERGWYNKDQLAKDLGLPERHINIQIFRFRKQLTECISNTTEAPIIIERRKGEIRLTDIGIKIESWADLLSLTDTTTQNTTISGASSYATETDTCTS